MDSWIRIAHRGASGVTPENTLVAFRKAIDIGVDAIEFDLHGTSDGEVVVIHDATLDRTTDKQGVVKHTTFENIKKADAGTWFDKKYIGESIPTLKDTLACITGNDTIAILEIKDVSITESVVKKIIEFGLIEYSIIISFHYSALQVVRSLEPRLSTGWLIGNHDEFSHPSQLCQKLSSLGSNLLSVNHQLITSDFAYEIIRRGVALWSWTVDDVVRMRQLLSYGVQGITSNYPELFSDV